MQKVGLTRLTAPRRMTTSTKAALYLPKAERPRERSLRPAPNHFSVLYSYTPAVQTIYVSDKTRRSKPSEFLLCAGSEGLLFVLLAPWVLKWGGIVLVVIKHTAAGLFARTPTPPQARGKAGAWRDAWLAIH